MKIERLVDVFVQNGQENDDCLHRKLFNINVNLFSNNREYREIVFKIIEYMKTILCTTFKDYDRLKGVSGANIGIPFNIVATLYNGSIEIFINPIVVKTSRSKKEISSNCGSLNLPKAIKVERYLWIQVEWIDVEGKKHKKCFTTDKDHNSTTKSVPVVYIPQVAYTLQHEIDHNNGILITTPRKEAN